MTKAARSAKLSAVSAGRRGRCDMSGVSRCNNFTSVGDWVRGLCPLFPLIQGLWQLLIRPNV